jgi:hypothetical protein
MADQFYVIYTVHFLIFYVIHTVHFLIFSILNCALSCILYIKQQIHLIKHNSLYHRNMFRLRAAVFRESMNTKD